MSEAISNEIVKQQILIALEDYRRQDWDDVEDKVDRAFQATGLNLTLRQFSECLDSLVESGDVREIWIGGDWAQLNRLRKPVAPNPDQLVLFEEAVDE